MMDIVKIKCPNCGGMIDRRADQYFVTCQYCGGEICFDEIKEEAALGGYINRIGELEQKQAEEEKIRSDFRRWVKVRNIYFAIMGACNLVGFSLVGSTDDKDSPAMAVGGTLMVIVVTLFLIGTPILSIAYPDYSVLTGQKDKHAKTKAYPKLLAAAFGVCIATSFLAYFFVKGA